MLIQLRDEDKCCYRMGDYNISLLNYDRHSNTLCKHTTPIIFSDDTNLFCNGSDPKDMEQCIDDELAKISQWLELNKLSLNVKKTHYMLFTKPRNIPLKLNIVIDNASIGEGRRTKFLGACFDNKLNFEGPYFLYIWKISGGTEMINEARNYANQDCLLDIYHAFIYLYFTSCYHAWGAT